MLYFLTSIFLILKTPPCFLLLILFSDADKPEELLKWMTWQFHRAVYEKHWNAFA